MSGKKYFREVSSGNISIEGTDANGMTLTNGNTYIYSGDTPPIIDPTQVNIEDPNKKVQPADPNNTSSYIAVTKAGNVNVNVGNANQQSLSVQNNNVVTNPPPKQIPAKAIIMGDSLTPSFQANSKKLQPTKNTDGVLWKSGITLVTLNQFIEKYSGDNDVTQIFISIGTNDTYLEFKNTPIKDFVELLKTKFPNAAKAIYIIRGLYGYAGLTDNGKDYYGKTIPNIKERITKYYKIWTDLGVFTLKNEVGYVTKHPGTNYPDSMKLIGQEIDGIISSNVTFTNTTTQQSPPIPPRQRVKISGSAQIELGEDDLYNDEFMDLPDEEAPVQLYEIVEPTDPDVTTTNYSDPKVYSQYFATTVQGSVIKRVPLSPSSGGGGGNPPATPAGNYKLDGERVSPDQCEYYFGNKTPYIAQYNNWGCFVTSITMVAQANGVGITQEMFYEAPSYTRKAKYILSGNACNFSGLKDDYPSLKRETKYSDAGTRVQIFEAYKKKLISLQRPMVIRIRGTKNAGRGHYIVAVGITKDGNIIVHNPGSQRIAFADQVIGSNMCLGTDQKSDNGKNYDIIYI